MDEGPFRVLLCEDAPDTRTLLAELLRLHGYDVVEADNGERAVEELRTGGYDMAFLDIGLPGINGYEVARRIRAASLPQRVGLVALTGYGSSADVAESRSAGIDMMLLKPVKFEQMLSAIELIRRTRQRS